MYYINTLFISTFKGGKCTGTMVMVMGPEENKCCPQMFPFEIRKRNQISCRDRKFL
jgi:hypothetical protein